MEVTHQGEQKKHGHQVHRNAGLAAVQDGERFSGPGCKTADDGVAKKHWSWGEAK